MDFYSILILSVILLERISLRENDSDIKNIWALTLDGKQEKKIGFLKFSI